MIQDSYTFNKGSKLLANYKEDDGWMLLITDACDGDGFYEQGYINFYGYQAGKLIPDTIESTGERITRFAIHEDSGTYGTYFLNMHDPATENDLGASKYSYKLSVIDTDNTLLTGIVQAGSHNLPQTIRPNLAKGNQIKIKFEKL